MAIGFKSIGAFAAAVNAGRATYSVFQKDVPGPNASGRWGDHAMAVGLPLFTVYPGVPLEATYPIQSRSIYCGDVVSPSTRHLHSMWVIQPNANILGQMILCDYLLYYPYVDSSSAKVQVFDNTRTLQRYATGEGVRAFLLVTGSDTVAGPTSWTYVNQDGVEKTQALTTQSVSFTTGTIAGTAITTQNHGMPYMKLAPGDSGIRSVTSLVGCTGGSYYSSCIVLVKPLAVINVQEALSPVELCFGNAASGAPRIYDGACLNFIGSMVSGSAGGFYGGMTTVWSE